MAKNNFNKAIKKHTKGKTLSNKSNTEIISNKKNKKRHLTNLNRGSYLNEGFSILKIILLILFIASITSFLFSGNSNGRTFYDFFDYLFTFPGVNVDWILDPNFLNIDGTWVGNFLDLLDLDGFYDFIIGLIKVIILLVTLILNAIDFIIHTLMYFF